MSLNMTEAEGYVQIDYFSVNNIEYDVIGTSTDLDDSYMMVNASTTETVTESEHHESFPLPHDTDNGHDTESSIPSDTSQQLLGLSLSALQSKMEHPHTNTTQCQSQKKQQAISKRTTPCHRRYKLGELYKLLVLISSMVTFVIYCYFYHRYFHAAQPTP